MLTPGTWRLPAEITADMVVDCQRWLRAYEQADRTAQRGEIEVWLMRLLGGLVGNRSLDDVRLRMDSFAFALRAKPKFCFTDAALDAAIRAFPKFWPTTGELLAFVEGIEDETRATARRAWKIVDRGVGRVSRDDDPNWTAASAEEKAAVGTICAGIRANLGQATVEMTGWRRPALRRRPPEAAE